MQLCCELATNALLEIVYVLLGTLLARLVLGLFLLSQSVILPVCV